MITDASTELRSKSFCQRALQHLFRCFYSVGSCHWSCDFVNRQRHISWNQHQCLFFTGNFNLRHSSANLWTQYYGLIFIGIGGFILSRLRHEKYSTDPSYIERKPYILIVSIHIILSGFICFLLEKDWFVGLTPMKKIPLYAILGSAITLAFVFSFVDFVNYFFGLCQRATERSVLETPKQVKHLCFIGIWVIISLQIFAVSAISLLMGLLYGFIFGWMDIEDADQYTLELKLMKDENYCMHIGIFLGGLGGFINEFFRRDVTLIFSDISLLN